MSAIKKSISMPDDLWSQLKIRAKKLNYRTTSAYFQALVESDLIRLGSHIRLDTTGQLFETTSPYNTPPPVSSPVENAAENMLGNAAGKSGTPHADGNSPTDKPGHSAAPPKRDAPKEKDYPRLPSRPGRNPKKKQ